MAFALVAASVVLAWGVRGIRSPDDTITVTGSARWAIRSDFAVRHGAFSTVDQDVRERTARASATASASAPSCATGACLRGASPGLPW